MTKTLKVDLHTHTTESDGRLAPAELARALASAGLDYVSVTDHDTLAVYERHADVLQRFGRRLISGVEVSTSIDGREVHVLGYGVPIGDSALHAVIGDRGNARYSRAQRIVDSLCSQGVRICMDDVLKQAAGAMIGRPHIARALVARGAATNISDAFERYIGSDCAAYVAVAALTPFQAIAGINKCGGVSVLAHPTRNEAEVLLDDLVRNGLQGIEAYSTSHTMHDAERFRALARKHKLVITAGTDFHGPTEANPHPGVEVDAGDLQAFLERVA